MQRFSRKDRVQEEIKREVADIIRRDVKDPRVGFVSITDAELSDDLTFVKIFYSTLDDDKLEEIQMGLEKATGYIRSEIGKRIRLRVTPEIVFRYDESLKRGARMMELLNEVKKKETGDGDGKDDNN
mgnify:FL=1|jgi:ribosome-binding factor A